MADTIRAHLEAETKRFERGLKSGLVFRALLLVIVVGYFAWMRSALSEVLTEDKLAEFVIQESKRQLPTVGEFIGRELKQAAPEIVYVALDGAVKEAIPKLREVTEDFLRTYSREMSEQASAASTEVFEEIVKTHSEELARRKDTDQGMYTPDQIAQTLSIEIARSLGGKMEHRLADKPEETVAQKLEKSLYALQNINEGLKQLAAKQDVGRKEELTRRFIANWWMTMKDRDQLVEKEERVTIEGTPDDLTKELIMKRLQAGAVAEPPADSLKPISTTPPKPPGL
jgi:hypothetical protein